MGHLKEESPSVSLTERLVSELYNFGNFDSILALLEESVVGFGSQMLQYAVGKKAVKSFLRKEYAQVAPCKIIKMRLRDRQSDKGQAVVANVILSTMRESSYILHRVVFMYQETAAGLRLNGIFISRDVHHESTYRSVRSRMFHRHVERRIDPSQSMDIMPNHMECVYLIYYMSSKRLQAIKGGALWKMLNYPSEEDFFRKSSHSMTAVVYAGDQRRMQTELTRQLLEGDSYQLEYRMKSGDGSLLWIMECGYRTLDKDGRVLLNSLLMDITPLRQMSENLLYRASYDALTGIYNKVAFYQKAQELIALHPDVQFAILRLNIERFKVINDLFGEKTGDQLLKYIAHFLEHVNLSLCVSGRLHSDNFVVCFPAEHNNCSRFIRSLQTMAASFSLDYKVVLGFGVYQVKERDLPVSVMCDRANLALNRAKGNYLVMYGEYDEHMRQHLVNEQAIVNEMNKALEQEEFILYVQPKYELTTERIIGGEVLVRWQHPVRGFVSPMEFIPVFEHNGFIFKLDQYVWEAACQLLRRWIDEGREPLPLSVNVSRIDLYNANLTLILGDLLHKYDLSPRLLELEITESAYTDNPRQIIEVTKKLQSMGFVILMDDFGSGYSSLNMLKDVPVDILKIDLKFLDSNDTSGRGGNILNSVVRMAKWLRIPVIAEGVETRQQAEFLRTIGCNRVQGYYYSRPVPVEAYEEKLSKGDCGLLEDQLSSQLDPTDVEDLLNPNAQVNLLFNSINGAVGLYETVNGQLSVIRVNDGYFRMFGYDREDFYAVEHNIMDSVYNGDRRTFMDSVKAAAETGKVTQCRIRRYRDDGRLLWLHIRISPVVHEKERQIFYLAIEDVTELEQKTMEMQALFDNIPAGFGVYELREGKIITHFLSKGAYDINQLTAEEFQQKTGGDLGKLLGQERIRMLWDVIMESYEKQCVMHVAYPFTTAKGAERWLRVSFKTVANETGEPDSYICYASMTDITETRKEMK